MATTQNLSSVIQDKHFVVIDDFLTPSYHQYILNESSKDGSVWNYHSNITYASSIGYRADDPSVFGFANTITNNGIEWKNNLYIPLCLQISDFLPPTTIGRVRLDMTCYTPEKRIHDAHVDTNTPHYASIYYVNDSDGETIIYNQEFDGDFEPPSDLTIMTKVEPKANRLLIFDGKYFHTGSSPSKHKNRIIINSNFYID